MGVTSEPSLTTNYVCDVYIVSLFSSTIHYGAIQESRYDATAI